MERKKVLILGIDGLDPRLTKKYIDEGRMPNTKKFLERGSAEIRYEMIGGQPTVTPPMWTTLATGASPRVHGITGYYRHNVERDILEYNFESTNCHAEQLWNVTAEAGIKTLVWHWPGSSLAAKQPKRKFIRYRRYTAGRYQCRHSAGRGRYVSFG